MKKYFLLLILSIALMGSAVAQEQRTRDVPFMPYAGSGGGVDTPRAAATTPPFSKEDSLGNRKENRRKTITVFFSPTGTDLKKDDIIKIRQLAKRMKENDVKVTMNVYRSKRKPPAYGIITGRINSIQNIFAEFGVLPKSYSQEIVTVGNSVVSPHRIDLFEY